MSAIRGKIDRDVLIDEAEDLVLELSEKNPENKEAIAKAVAQFLDAIVPLDVLIPGPLGQIAEQKDEAVFSLLIKQLTRVFHADPAKKAERQLRRQQRREERQRRREERQRRREEERLEKENDDAS